MITRISKADARNGLAASVTRFVAYGGVSVLAAAFEFACLQALLVLHVAQGFAVSAAFCGASGFQFCMLRYVVFRVTHRPVIFQVNAYIFAAIFSWCTVLAGVTILTRVFPLHTLEARAILIPVLFPVNYLISRFLVFRR